MESEFRCQWIGRKMVRGCGEESESVSGMKYLIGKSDKIGNTHIYYKVLCLSPMCFSFTLRVLAYSGV